MIMVAAWSGKGPLLDRRLLIVFSHGCKGPRELSWVSLFFLFSGRTARLAEILVPQPVTEPLPMAVKVPSPNCWTTREVPWVSFIKALIPFMRVLHPYDLITSQRPHLLISLP